MRMALQVLIEVIMIAIRDQNGLPKDIDALSDDPDGLQTLQTLTVTLGLVQRITGNDGGSLGLHPAVYFYGPTGRHSSPMFMGMITLIAKKLVNNDKNFFKKFSTVRGSLEKILIEYKDLIATILQKQVSHKRVEHYANLLSKIVDSLVANHEISELDLVKFSGLDGKIIVGQGSNGPKRFSDDTKSQIFIRTALASASKCPICNGYLDTAKSVSYDHVIRVQDGGTATASNLQLTLPYCNQSVKN